MTKEQNKQHASSLRKLAEVYEAVGNSVGDEPGIQQNGMYIFLDNKADLLNVIRAVGGLFTKEYAYDHMVLRTARIPGLHIQIPRDKVCRKITTYECEPLFGPEDESEIDAELLSSSAAGA